MSKRNPKSHPAPPPEDTLVVPVSRSASAKCAGQHFGAWAIDPKWFKAAMDSIRAGTIQPKADAFDDEDDGEDSGPGYRVVDGVAVICIDGQMTKRGSSFGGCSTIEVRRSLRLAADDWMVRSVLLHICSPGGTVAGTADLAADVAAVRDGSYNGRPKPVNAYIADMGCSAAYWVASQCETITANVTAVVGSIGTYTVLEDDAGMQEQVGIKYRVVSTGDYKGLGADGKVSDMLVADVQREVNELNAPFLAAVAIGRAGKIADVTAIADGRAHVGEQAKQLGLIDSIASVDAAIEAISSRSIPMTATEQVKQIAAEHPESVAAFREEGKRAGKAEAHQEETARMKAVAAACPGRADLAVKLFCAGHDADHAATVVTELDAEAGKVKAREDAHRAELAAKEQEIERLKHEAAGRRPIATAAANKPGEEDGDDKPDPVAAFDAAVAERVKAGMDKPRAIAATVRENPQLHAEYVAESNRRVREKSAARK